MLGKRPSPEEEKLLKLVNSLLICASKTISPCFSKYFGITPVWEFRQSGSLSYQYVYMGVTRGEDKCYIEVNEQVFKKGLSYFHKGLGERIYFSAHFLHAAIHEFIHVIQPPEAGDNYKKWREGTAHLLSWLILCKLYKDADQEFFFWLLRKNPQDVLVAMKNKKLKLGLERVIAVYNYYFSLAFRQENKEFKIPEFLPRSIKKLIHNIIKDGRPPFQHGLSADTLNALYEQKKVGEQEQLLRWDLREIARGIIVAEHLLVAGNVSAKDLIGKPLDDKTIDSLFEQIYS